MVGGNVKWCGTLENILKFFKMPDILLAADAAIPTPQVYPRNENTRPQKHVYECSQQGLFLIT